jgi:hypothetical protein
MSLNVELLTVTVKPGLFVGFSIKAMQNQPATCTATLRLAGVMRWWQQWTPLGMSNQLVVL